MNIDMKVMNILLIAVIQVMLGRSFVCGGGR